MKKKIKTLRPIFRRKKKIHLCESYFSIRDLNLVIHIQLYEKVKIEVKGPQKNKQTQI